MGASQPMGIFCSLRKREKTVLGGLSNWHYFRYRMSPGSLALLAFLFVPYRFFTCLPRRLGLLQMSKCCPNAQPHFIKYLCLLGYSMITDVFPYLLRRERDLDKCCWTPSSNLARVGELQSLCMVIPSVLLGLAGCPGYLDSFSIFFFH